MPGESTESPSTKAMKSDVLHQIGHARLDGAGNPPQRRQRNMLLAPLDPSHVVRMKPGLFGQLLLAESSALPVFADGGAKNDTIIKTRPHRYTQPQTSAALYTAKRMIFCLRCRRLVW